MIPHNPDCETCTYAWCCGSCFCCGATERRIAAENRARKLNQSHQWEYDFVSWVNRCAKCFTAEDSDEDAEANCAA